MADTQISVIFDRSSWRSKWLAKIAVAVAGTTLEAAFWQNSDISDFLKKNIVGLMPRHFENVWFLAACPLKCYKCKHPSYLFLKKYRRKLAENFKGGKSDDYLQLTDFFIVYNPEPYVVENCVRPPIWSYWEGSSRIHSDQAYDASADPAIIVQRKIRHTNVETDILTSTLTL